MHLSSRLLYLNDDEYSVLDDMSQAAAKTLFGLIRAVEKEVNVISKDGTKSR